MIKKYLISTSEFEQSTIKEAYKLYQQYTKSLGFTTTISETSFVKEMVNQGCENLISRINETNIIN